MGIGDGQRHGSMMSTVTGLWSDTRRSRLWPALSSRLCEDVVGRGGWKTPSFGCVDPLSDRDSFQCIMKFRGRKFLEGLLSGELLLISVRVEAAADDNGFDGWHCRRDHFFDMAEHLIHGDFALSNVTCVLLLLSSPVIRLLFRCSEYTPR